MDGSVVLHTPKGPFTAILTSHESPSQVELGTSQLEAGLIWPDALHTPHYRKRLIAKLEWRFRHQPSSQRSCKLRMQLLVRRPATGIFCTCIAEERCNGSKKYHQDGTRLRGESSHKAVFRVTIESECSTHLSHHQRLDTLIRYLVSIITTRRAIRKWRHIKSFWFNKPPVRQKRLNISIMRNIQTNLENSFFFFLYCRNNPRLLTVMTAQRRISSINLT